MAWKKLHFTTETEGTGEFTALFIPSGKEGYHLVLQNEWIFSSQTTPTRTEAAKEEETLKSLVDILQQVMRSVPTQGTPAQHSAVTPTLTDTIDALWLKVYRKHAKKQKNLENVAMARKPTPSTPPSVLTLQTDPDISVVVCVYESTQLTTALKELALIFQAAATKKKNKTLDQLINGFSEIFEECFKKRNVKYRN